VVTLCIPSLKFNNSTFCPRSVFMCFVWIWEQTAIISQNNINWLVCITETKCVYFAVRTGRLYIFQVVCFVYRDSRITSVPFCLARPLVIRTIGNCWNTNLVPQGGRPNYDVGKVHISKFKLGMTYWAETWRQEQAEGFNLSTLFCLTATWLNLRNFLNRKNTE
jgi:hypothetical protein